MRSAVAVAVSIVVAACLAPPVQAAPGDLDATFGVGGLRVVAGSGGAGALAVQPDGKLVVAGSSAASFGVARYGADGTLDPTFSGDRTAPASGRAIAVQGDGKIVVTGTTNVGNTPYWALARFNPDGSLDPTFSGDGWATLVRAGFEGYANAIAVQGDGKIVIAGQANINFGAARYTASGALDPSFGDDGTALIYAGNEYDAAFANAMVLQPDGKLVLAGISDPQWTCDPVFPYCPPLPPATGVLARIDADGKLDPSFGDHGVRNAGPVGQFGFTALARGADGALAAGGEGGLARFTADGTVAGLEGVNAGAAVAVQPDGKIVAVGRYDWTVSRYLTDGSRDPSFTRRITLFPGYTFATPSALAFTPEGKTVVVGDVANYGGPSFFALARYETDAPNAGPHAQIDHSCTGTVCFVHGFGSSDPDGTIAHYKWDFPDGTSASDAYVRKDLGAYGTHTVRLTVTDNRGATATRELTVTLLQLTARGSLPGGFQTIQLTWNANPGTLYWVYRGAKKVGIVAGSGIVDRPPVAASGIYSYAVCEASGPICSASETVKFAPGG